MTKLLMIYSDPADGTLVATSHSGVELARERVADVTTGAHQLAAQALVITAFEVLNAEGYERATNAIDREKGVTDGERPNA